MRFFIMKKDSHFSLLGGEGYFWSQITLESLTNQWLLRDNPEYSVFAKYHWEPGHWESDLKEWGFTNRHSRVAIRNGKGIILGLIGSQWPLQGSFNHPRKVQRASVQDQKLSHALTKSQIQPATTTLPNFLFAEPRRSASVTPSPVISKAPRWESAQGIIFPAPTEKLICAVLFLSGDHGHRETRNLSLCFA